MSFSTAEQAVVIAALATTVVLFSLDLARKLVPVPGGPPDRPRLDRIDRRIFRVVSEVLFQSRVIGGRHIVGVFHACVFLGFVSFALETIDMVLEPFGIDFLRTIFGRDGVHTFHTVLAAIAIGVAVSITALAFRRFALVKISPDPRSWSSGLVALMILLLMLTYLNGIRAHPWIERANWWLHLTIILTFPFLILRSKHFHIMLAPVAIFLRKPRLGELPPMDLDIEALSESEEEVTLGLESMADVSWKTRLDFLTCVECKRCTEACPAWSSGQELDPRGFILAGRKMLGHDGPVIGNVISERALGQCTTCGACENACPVGIEHLNVIFGAKRAQALSTGQGIVAGELFQNVERSGNPFAVPGDARARLIAELGIPPYENGKTEYLLWLGCVWAYNQDARSSLESMVEVLNRAGVSYGVLESESCSGHHSRRQGEEMQFQTLAGENVARFQEHGVEKLVTGCPHCLHTIRHEYRELHPDLSVETMHHSELLMQLIEQGALRLAPNGSKRVTFHDPCYLGRYEGVFDAPREVIAKSGFDLVELPRRRERSFCCGGGGGGFVREQQEEWRVDQERKREIAESGVDVLVTACPECKMMLNAAVEETFDLAELVARSTRGS